MRGVSGFAASAGPVGRLHPSITRYAQHKRRFGSGTGRIVVGNFRDAGGAVGHRTRSSKEPWTAAGSDAGSELLIDHLSKTNLPGVRLSVSEVLTSAKLSCAQIE